MVEKGQARAGAPVRHVVRHGSHARGVERQATLHKARVGWMPF